MMNEKDSKNYKIVKYWRRLASSKGQLGLLGFILGIRLINFYGTTPEGEPIPYWIMWVLVGILAIRFIGSITSGITAIVEANKYGFR